MSTKQTASHVKPNTSSGSVEKILLAPDWGDFIMPKLGKQNLPRSDMAVSWIHAKHEAKKAIQYGGYRNAPIKYETIQTFLQSDCINILPANFETLTFQYADHVLQRNLEPYATEGYISIWIPLEQLVDHIPVSTTHHIAELHGIQTGIRVNKKQLKTHLTAHHCTDCREFKTVLSFNLSLEKQLKEKHQTQWKMRSRTLQEKQKLSSIKEEEELLKETIFPPQVLNNYQMHQIIAAACKDMDKNNIEEGGCTVCGRLEKLTNLSRASAIKNQMSVLAAPGITRQERHSHIERVKEHALALDESCDMICNTFTSQQTSQICTSKRTVDWSSTC
jgi:hypothetical protein